MANGGAWYIGALAAPGVAGLLFEKESDAFIGDYPYPLYGVGPDVVDREDAAELARTYGRPGGFLGAAALYRDMLTEGPDLRELAQHAPLRGQVSTIGSSGGGFTHASFSGVAAREPTQFQMDGVGHYVAQEAPHDLADILLQVFDAAGNR